MEGGAAEVNAYKHSSMVTIRGWSPSTLVEQCNELRLLLFNHVVIIRLLCMTSLMVNTCIYSVYWTILV